MKNDKDEAEPLDEKAPVKPPPEHGAESQLHNYNIVLSRLGDLFGDDDEPEPPKPEK